MIEIIARLCTEIDKRLRRHAVGVTQNLSANPGRLPSTIQSSPEYSLIHYAFSPWSHFGDEKIRKRYDKHYRNHILYNQPDIRA